MYKKQEKIVQYGFEFVVKYKLTTIDAGQMSRQNLLIDINQVHFTSEKRSVLTLVSIQKALYELVNAFPIFSQ